MKSRPLDCVEVSFVAHSVSIVTLDRTDIQQLCMQTSAENDPQNPKKHSDTHTVQNEGDSQCAEAYSQKLLVSGCTLRQVPEKVHCKALQTQKLKP